MITINMGGSREALMSATGTAEDISFGARTSSSGAKVGAGRNQWDGAQRRDCGTGAATSAAIPGRRVRARHPSGGVLGAEVPPTLVVDVQFDGGLPSAGDDYGRFDEDFRGASAGTGTSSHSAPGMSGSDIGGPTQRYGRSLDFGLASRSRPLAAQRQR